MTTLILVALVVILLLLRQSILLVLAVGTAYTHLFLSNSKIVFMMQDVWAAIDKEILLAVPMFILAGAVMTRGSIAARLIRLVSALTAPIPGGLGVAAILSCTVFAAISGSSIVTMLAISTIMYPALLAAGYDRRFSIGMLCAGGTLGIIIPPSIPMILYGIMTEVSITRLFLAGILPGLLLASMLSAYAIGMNYNRERSRWNVHEILASAKEGLLALFLPVLLLGGIYSGHFTPTESAAIALIYALLVESLVYRELSLRDFHAIVAETAALLGMLLPLLALATSLNVIMDYERVPQALVALMQGFIDSRFTFLLASNILLIVAGCFMEVGSAIVILGPLLAPIAASYGVDPVHFGIIMTVNLEIGYITPPVGLNLFVAMVAFKESFGAICRAVVPFILIMLAGLVVICAFPGLSLWLGG
ncbi:MAG: TRAP transporter large permease [Alphaproteobacteria bacterium]|nr:TRAP transporter large permease [Alphaproteobacteria bacterium]